VNENRKSAKTFAFEEDRLAFPYSFNRACAENQNKTLFVSFAMKFSQVLAGPVFVLSARLPLNGNCFPIQY